MPLLIALIVLLVQASAFAQVAAENFSGEQDNYEKLLATRYVLLPHRGTYVMPYVHNSLTHEDLYSGMKAGSNNGNDLYGKTEAEFQVSFLLPISRDLFATGLDLNFAYTHHAWWQVYNTNWSRPFRETNYMPEIFLRHIDRGSEKVFGFDFMGVDFGYLHESNGQIQTLTRSWDRAFARTYLQQNGYMIYLAAWVRLPNWDEEENPNITDYMGHGDIELYKSFGLHTFSFQTALLSKYYSGEIQYSYPWKDRLRWFVKAQVGYGHSLIEYNRPVERYSVGFALDSLVNRGDGGPQ